MAKKIFSAWLIVLAIFFSSSTGAAEDLRFIDSTGDTGYYIDMNSVRRESPSVISVDFIVIRADKNEMTIADVSIDYAEKSYIVKSARTLSYDVRNEISSDKTRRPKKFYSDRSLMHEIVQMILSEGN